MEVSFYTIPTLSCDERITNKYAQKKKKKIPKSKIPDNISIKKEDALKKINFIDLFEHPLLQLFIHVFSYHQLQIQRLYLR